jgi:hypothetical protein
MAEFGLAPQDHPDLDGDQLHLPCVESIRSARRVGPNGQIIFDLVAEVTQRRTVRASFGRTACEYYGGATVILGPEGNVRYVISKSMLSRERLQRQLEFIAGRGEGFWEDRRGKLVPRQHLFALVHRDGAGS